MRMILFYLPRKMEKFLQNQIICFLWNDRSSFNSARSLESLKDPLINEKIFVLKCFRRDFLKHGYTFTFIYAFRSDLEFLVPQGVQSDGLHCTVVTKPAAEHFPQHVDQVHVMLCVHCIVVVKV